MDVATDAFRDRTIEATQSTQGPVVSKEARVIEEVPIKKTIENLTETVNDKVRSTKVEVEDQRSTGAGKADYSGR